MANLQMPAIRKHKKEMSQPRLKNNQCKKSFLKKSKYGSSKKNSYSFNLYQYY